MTSVTGEWLTNPPTQALCAALTDAGYQAYFVGGCVRDALLGVSVNDIDIATDARPEQVIALSEAAGMKTVPTGVDHGTVTVIAAHLPHEVTTFRRDVDTDGRRAVVAFSNDIAEDARRRDFTINALYADPDGKVHDPLGGLPDLAARRIRFIEDADQRIREDFLRILRFFRFHAWYGDADAGLDAEGLAACAANSAGLETLSKERVGSEVKKLLTAPDPSPSVAAMMQTGVLARVLPGADARALPVLVHLEQQAGIGADPIRRLAALGVGDGADLLRLSKDEARRLSRLGAHIGNMMAPGELGYRLGAEEARDVLLLRAAVLDAPLDPDALAVAQAASGEEFPVRAADLMPGLKGAALGAMLNELEARWIASGFALSKSELLG